MILAGHQPNYLPNLSFFSKMKQVDCFVISLNLQFQRDKSWQRRNRIPGPNGDIWLTVPVHGGIHQISRDVLINNNLPWRHRHRQTLHTLYANQGGAELLPHILAVYDQPHTRLADLNCAFIRLLASLCGVTTPIFIDEETMGYRHELVINTCRKYKADHYLAGTGGHDYMDEEYCQALSSHGITYSFDEKNVGERYPYSTVHYLLAHGPAWVQSLL